MAKRDLSVDDAKSPSKKRAKSGGQTQLDTFFSRSPNKPQTMRSEDGPSTERRKVDGTKGDAPLSPLVIDVDAEGESSKPPAIQLRRVPKKEVNRHAYPAEVQPLQFASLDVDPVSYLPHEQPWLENGAPYAFLTHALSTLSQTHSRIIIINSLTNCLRTIIAKHPESLLPSLYLLSNTLAPSYTPVELGLGPSIISRSIQNVSGITPAALKKLYNALGDPGDVAVSAKTNLRTLIPHPPLTIAYVFDSLLKIAYSKGQGAAKQKEKIVEKLLLSANGEEIRYLTRTLCQNIRVGAVRTSMLTALARAVVLSHVSADMPEDGDTLQISPILLRQMQESPSNSKAKAIDPNRTRLNDIFSKAEAIVKGVFVRHPNYADIVSALLDTGLRDLEEKVPLAIGSLCNAIHGSTLLLSRHTTTSDLGIAVALFGRSV